MCCNGRTFEELPPWLKLPCRSGLQWTAMGGLFRNYPPDWNCHVSVGCNGLQWEDFLVTTPPPDWNCQVRVGCRSEGVICAEGVRRGKSWAAMGGLLRNYPPDWNCHVRVGCNGLQWEDFSWITPWLKLQCKSGLQWAAMDGLFRNYPLSEIAM